MKFSKMICAIAVASLLMLQNVAPMVPVMADTTETTVETEATEETKHHEETAKPKETTRQTESSETSETTKASEKPVETTVPSETTEPSDDTKPSETTKSTEPSESAVTAETTAPTEKTESSETTASSETSESTTETTESSKPSETTSETTIVEAPKIVKAKTADEYIKLVAALPDGDKLIVATNNDLSALKPSEGVYFDFTDASFRNCVIDAGWYDYDDCLIGDYTYTSDVKTIAFSIEVTADCNRNVTYFYAWTDEESSEAIKDALDNPEFTNAVSPTSYQNGYFYDLDYTLNGAAKSGFYMLVVLDSTTGNVLMYGYCEVS